MQTFYRLLLRGETYYSLKYGRVTKRNSYTVLYNGSHYGFIVCYYFVSGCPVALVKELECASSTSSCIGGSSPVVGICAVSETDNYSVISVNSIVEKCVCVSVGVACKYIARFPSRIIAD